MWRMSIEEIIAAIADDQAHGGGTQEERVATAHLLLGLFHVEAVELARGLRNKASVERVSVAEAPDKVTLGVDGAYCTLVRCSGQSEMRLQFTGYHPDVVPYEQANKGFPVAKMSVEVAQQAVAQVVELCGQVIRQDLAVRNRKV